MIWKTNMEAPEKIYLFENPISGTPDDRWLAKKSCDTDIEYIHKDTFIKKAWDWIEDNLLTSNQQDKSRLYFEQFKNYIGVE